MSFGRERIVRDHVYKFYWRDPLKGYQLIGTLPERRKNLLRITQESIMNLGKKIFGDNIDRNEILFIQITVDDNESFHANDELDFLSDIEYMI